MQVDKHHENYPVGRNGARSIIVGQSKWMRARGGAGERGAAGGGGGAATTTSATTAAARVEASAEAKAQKQEQEQEHRRGRSSSRKQQATAHGGCVGVGDLWGNVGLLGAQERQALHRD